MQSPGNEQREFWSSKSADVPGSRNITGIKNPAIDKLIERLIYARNRDDLVAATKALDRVLLWNHYVVPQWTYTKVRTRALGPLRSTGGIAQIRPVRLPVHLVVRRRQGGADRKEVVKDSSRMTQISRRHVLALGVGGGLGAALGARLVRGAAASEAGTEGHGISAFGDLKYPADFHHFDYVNVDAPKGGAFSLIPSVRAYNQSYFTFSSLNAYILKGEGAQGMDMTFAPLDGTRQ